MYRVVIVDDEEPVLNSYEFIFQKYAEDFTVCGKARSGNEAVKVVKELKPDVVFMDIQMPGLSGLEAVKELKPWVPGTLFILATAYERFDIAQRAITTGIFDYLVKPVSKTHILDELKKVKIELDKQNELTQLKNDQIKYNQKINLERDEKFFNSIIWNTLEDSQWEEIKIRKDFTSNSGFISVVKIVNNINDDLRDQIFRDISHKIQYRYSSVSYISGAKLLIFLEEDSNNDRYREYIDRFFTDLHNIEYKIGIGDNHKIEDIHLSYKEANFSLKNEKSCYSSGNLKEVFNQIINSDKKQGKIVFEEYWKTVFTNNNFELAKGVMISLFTLLFYKLDNEKLSIAEEIVPIDNIEKWKEWSIGALDKFYISYNKDKMKSVPKPLKAALNYIHSNYKETLQLSSVAEMCSISSSHLSRLFTEHLGTKFIDYLNVYRLEKATELLKEGNISIKEAAFSVGYSDPNYFSRIYRKYMGVSPSSIE